MLTWALNAINQAEMAKCHLKSKGHRMKTPAQCMDCAHRIANQELPGEDGLVDLCDTDMDDYSSTAGDFWIDPGGHCVTHPCGFCHYKHPSMTKWTESRTCDMFEAWADLYDDPEKARAELSESAERG